MLNTPSPFLNLAIGGVIHCGAKKYTITHLLDLENILARSVDTGELRRLPIKEITSDTEKADQPDGSFSSTSIPDADWNEAMRRFEIILPLLSPGTQRTRDLVTQRASEYNVSATAVYRWISIYQSTGVVSSLVRKKRSDKGSYRLSPEVDLIIKNCIEDLYLNNQRYSVSTIHEVISSQCKTAGLPVPHPNTVRMRISEITEAKKLSLRKNRKDTIQKFAPIRGHFPGADFPLAVVQIDHTPLDIIVVDEVTRLPIGRPWITMAIDVFSRTVCGFYIAMEAPSSMSVALCIAHSILPKERWLASKNISYTWPIWGVPDNILADNAKEFRGNSFRKACSEYGITLNWRPVARPNYGGHIERMLGTLSKAIHEVPGTTFSNPIERGDYDSDAKAVLTLTELEKWITIYVIGRYHEKIHSELSMPPIKKFEAGILGDKNIPGHGLPPRLHDESRVLLDFMPFFERTIQNYGVVFEHIEYYSNVLRKWIHAKDADNPKLKRKFVFRYDPRDISKIYFLDPELNLYYPIPYKNTARPALSIWELREAERTASKYNNSIDEDLLFAAYEELREIEKSAKKTTKKVRRAQQHKRDHTNRKISLNPIAPTPIESDVKKEPSAPELITAFDDIDEDI